MKKLIISIAIMLLIVLSGCAVQPQTAQPDQETQKVAVDITEPAEETAPATTTTAPATTTTTQTKPAQTTTTTQTTSTESSDYNFEALPKDQQRKIKLVRNLLTEAANREENYFYRYSGPGVAQTDVWVKGNVIKRTILRDDQLDKFKHYNMVYVYRDRKQAWGYCETTKSKCWAGKGPFDETYETRLLKTPKDWVLELGDEFTWALDNKIADQLYHIVDFRKDGKTTRVYVNDYRGVPYKVEIYNKISSIDSISLGTAEETYLFDDMDIGAVTDDDVTPPV
ncbi:hypothetical protein KY363_06590 [Candidatus Woesearchaeota archaeon]|nr:hypothetical protein [Candidatus Woesearchaeota archaeon]